MTHTNRADEDQEGQSEGGNKSRVRKVTKGAAAVSSEVSGITFLKRGISANYRAVASGKDLLVGSFKEVASLKNATKNLVNIDDISETERQIKQANSLFSAMLYLTILFCGLVAFLSQNDSLALLVIESTSSSLGGKSLVFMVAILSVTYFLASTVLCFRDFQKISRVTKPPKQLALQYDATFISIFLICFTHSVIAILFNSAPDLSIQRAVLGFLTLTTAVSLFRSSRRIYDPSLPHAPQKGYVESLVRSLFGLAISRFTPGELSFEKYPAFLMLTLYVAVISSISLSEGSFIGLISMLSQVLGIAVVTSISIYRWGLSHD